MACFNTYNLLAEVCDPEQSAENLAVEGRCQVALHQLWPCNKKKKKVFLSMA